MSIFQFYCQKVEMNSLRTDDIIGAMPRVRHMPMNLIRERKYPNSYKTNIEHYKDLPSSEYVQNPHQYEINYKNNSINDYPFYQRNKLTKEPRYINYEGFQMQQDHHFNNSYAPHRQTKQSRNYGNQSALDLKNDRSYSSRSTEKVNNTSSIQNVEMHIQNVQKQPEKSPSNKSMGNNNNKSSQRKYSSSSISQMSNDNKDVAMLKDSREERKIFRGLGFNIITNNKFQYRFEQSDPTAIKY